MNDETISVTLSQEQDFRFKTEFGGAIAPLSADLPPPLGQGQGPSPEHLLCAAVGNCLSSSLLFALRKYRQAPDPITCTVSARVGRNAEGRLRVLELLAQIQLGQPAAALEHLDRALGQFESFCTVTQSVRAGIPTRVEVRDATGAVLKS